MEASMLNMILVAKFTLDVQNEEKQRFYKQLNMTEQRTNATHNKFIASMERKSIS
jgi:hypothetical protein